jgi:predicted porin
VGHVRYGYVELGSHWNPAIWLTGRVDPFGRQQMGAIEAILQGTAVRGFLPAMPNSVAYVTPDVGGFRGRAVVQAAEGVVAAGNRALSLDYVNERLYVGLLYDYAQVTGASLGRPGTPALRSKTTAIGATYRFQPVKVHGYVQHNQVEGLPAVNGYMLGASVPIGAGELRASIVKTSNPSATATQVAIGYIHSLSKRTQIYTTAARIENRGLARFALWPSSADRGAANAPLAGQQATGVQFGIRHFF